MDPILITILTIWVLGIGIAYVVTKNTFRTEFEHIWFSVVWFITLFFYVIDKLYKKSIGINS